MTKPDNKVQKIISIFGKKKCNCGCDGNHDNSAGTPMAHNLIKGEGFPTEDTAGTLGDYYRDELSNRTFECVDITEEYDGINGQEIAQVSDGEDISYINIDSLNEGDYAALTAGVQVNNLYQLQNGELIEIPFEQVDNENDVYFSADIKHVVCINSGNNMYYIYTPAETYPAYHWTATEHRTFKYVYPKVALELRTLKPDGFINTAIQAFFNEEKFLYVGDSISLYSSDSVLCATATLKRNIYSEYNYQEGNVVEFENVSDYFEISHIEAYSDKLINFAKGLNLHTYSNLPTQNATAENPVLYYEIPSDEKSTNCTFYFPKESTDESILINAQNNRELIWHQIIIRNQSNEEKIIEIGFDTTNSTHYPVKFKMGPSTWNRIWFTKIDGNLLGLGNNFVFFDTIPSNNPS